MLENITKVIARFFGIIAGSLSGISAILIAIGYLTERSHLRMLGFTSIPVDLNQYLYTGANLLSILPGIIILQSILLLQQPLTVGILSIILLIRLSLKIQKWKDFWDKMLKHSQRIAAKFKISILIFFVIVQIFSMNWMIQAVKVENMLFPQDRLSDQHKFTYFNSNANIDYLKQLLIAKDKDKLSKYFTQLFLITLLIGLAIRYLMFLGNENQSTMSFRLKFWLVLNVLLFLTQVILLPRNYGALLLSIKYQEVKVQFKSKERVVALGEDKKQFTGFNINVEAEILPWESEVAHPISQKTLVLVEIPCIRDLIIKPAVFKVVDKDPVHYIFQSSFSINEVAGINVTGNKLTIQPISKRNAGIVIAANDVGHFVRPEFNLIILEEELKWPVDDRLLLLYQSNNAFFLYSRLEKRIWYVRADDIESMVYYGLIEAF